MRAWTRIETCLGYLGSNLFWRSSQTILLKCFHEIFFQILTYNTMKIAEKTRENTKAQ